MSTLEQIQQALSQIRISAQPEEWEIHLAVQRALEDAGIEYIHEYKLGPGRRIDFLCGNIGIEVKKGRPNAARLRTQLTRYLQSPDLNAAIVVLQRPCSLPDKLCGKPLRVLSLNRLWGVALP